MSIRKAFFLVFGLMLLQITTALHAQWEKQPEFPGGSDAMISFIDSIFRYPSEAVDKKVQGRVITNFVIEKDGSVTEVKLVRGVDSLLDNEAIRILGLMPKWKPAEQWRSSEQASSIVRVRFTLPILFKLDDEGNALSYKDGLKKAEEERKQERERRAKKRLLE
ncbi:MAG: energy transducer TonB [Proteiniphilum sp.]|nr:energy transducer TonB [Proteiniphilum sp.]